MHGPINWEAVTAISTAVYALFTVLLVIVGICAIRVTVKQLTQSREQNKIGHLEDQAHQFDGAELRQVRQSLADKRIDKVRKTLRPLDIDHPPPELEEILNFFEHMALLYCQNYLDLYPIWHTFGYWIFCFYADSREYIEQERKDDDAIYEDLCHLVDDLRTVEAERGGDWDRPSPEDRFWFYEGESHFPPKPPQRRRGRKSKIPLPQV